jgi:hypothetical protein
MRRLSIFSALLFSLIVQAAVARCQQLTIQDAAGKSTSLTRTDLEALPRVKITTSTSGTRAEFDGVAMKDVLQKAGVAFGDTMRGKRMASCLLVEAADGYRAVIALPEVDPAFTDKKIVLAFLKDGKALDDKEGPYRIVIPEEKRMARWVRQVTTLKIVDVQ